MASNLTPAVCVHLRTRSNYIPALQQRNLDYTPDDYTPCQCVKTLHVVGPDDCPVAVNLCVAGRPCYQGLNAVVA